MPAFKALANMCIYICTLLHTYVHTDYAIFPYTRVFPHRPSWTRGRVCGVAVAHFLLADC